MNLLILSPSELDAAGHTRLSGRRHEHLRKILKAKPGDLLRAGVLDHSMGHAEVLGTDYHQSVVAYRLDPALKPPAPLACQLILALPRPPVLRRTLQTAAALGFKDIHLIHSERVEKSYWQSPDLEQQKMHTQLLLGLEQAVDILMPRVHLQRRFRPFAEDLLPSLQTDRPTYLADPRGSTPCPAVGSTPCNLMIGPEGGWVPFELELLDHLGVTSVQLGRRILRVETALPYMAGRLQLGRDNA